MMAGVPSAVERLIDARSSRRRLAPLSETYGDLTLEHSYAIQDGHLATRGLALKPGDIVMSGSISKLLRPTAGDTVGARLRHLGAVSVKLVP